MNRANGFLSLLSFVFTLHTHVLTLLVVVLHPCPAKCLFKQVFATPQARVPPSSEKFRKQLSVPVLQILRERSLRQHMQALFAKLIVALLP